MAALCYAYNLTPREYRTLTLEEHAALVRLLKKLKEQRDRG